MAPGSKATTPEDIVNATLYLASDEAGGITGARIPVFGRG